MISVINEVVEIFYIIKIKNPSELDLWQFLE